MKWLESCLIAISMYSKIPVPQVEWTKEKMSHAMCFFPLVGVIEGCFVFFFLTILKIHPSSHKKPSQS